MIEKIDVQFNNDELYVLKHSLALCGCQGADAYLLNRFFTNDIAIEKAKKLYRKSHTDITSLEMVDVEILLIAVTEGLKENTGVFNSSEVQLDTKRLRKRLISLRRLGGVAKAAEPEREESNE